MHFFKVYMKQSSREDMYSNISINKFIKIEVINI